MKQTRLLLSALLLTLAPSITAQTPTALWGKSVQMEMDKGTGVYSKYTNGSDIQLAANGDLYIIGSAQTRNEDEFLKFGSDNIAPGTLYRGTNENSKALMIFLTKLSADGQPQWTVYSKDADAMSNSMFLQPTSDGVVAFLALRHTEKGADYSPFFMDATGTKFDLEWTLETADAGRYYLGIVMKVSSEGVIQWIRKVEADHAPQPYATSVSAKKVTGQGMSPNTFALDTEGNLYLGGRQTTELSLLKSDGSFVKIAPHNVPDTWDGEASVGDFFIIKLDKDGYYLNHLQTEGAAKYVYLAAMKYFSDRIYVTGYFVPDGLNKQVSIGGKAITLPNEFATPFLASLNTDLTANWAQTYEAQKKGFTIQTPGLYVNNSNIWLVGTSMLSLKTKSGKAIDTGDLTRGGTVMKFDATDGTLLDGYVKAIDQTGYFAAFEGEDCSVYAVAHQGYQTSFAPMGGSMWIDKFNPVDLVEPISTWENMIQNAAGTQNVVYTASGRLYSMTRSKVVPNALMNSDMTIDQSSTAFCCNICAFQLPVTPVTAIRSIENIYRTDGYYYNLNGQRVEHPTKGIYIQNGKKILVK